MLKITLSRQFKVWDGVLLHSHSSKDKACLCLTNACSEAVSREIGPTLWKIGSTDFVKVCQKRCIFEIIEHIVFLNTIFFAGKDTTPKQLHYTREPFRCKYCRRYRAGITHYLLHLRRHELSIKPYWYKSPNLPPKIGAKCTLRHWYRTHATMTRKQGKPEEDRRQNLVDDSGLHLSKRKKNITNVAKKTMCMNRDTCPQTASTRISVIKDKYNTITHEGSKSLHGEKEISFVSSTCQYCSKEFFTQSCKEAHEMICKTEEWKCEHWECEKSFPKFQSAIIQLHEMEHWRKILQKAQNITAYEKTHTPAVENYLSSVNSSYCKFCDKICSSPKLLQIHKFCHKKRWKCIHCFKSFAKTDCETNQVCTHQDGDKTHQLFMKKHLYNCSHCEMSFTTQADLQSHVVMETCKLCDMAVNCLYERAKHLKICNFCKKSLVITSAKQKYDAILLLHRIY